MRTLKAMMALVLVLVVTACSGSGGLFAKDPAAARSADISQLPGIRVAGWAISVPQTLSVSELNSIKPRADIVWHGDPLGDRYAQVAAIFETGVQNAARQFSGNLPVELAIDVIKFHAITPRLRYAFSGEHEIEFGLEITNAQTGEVLVPRYIVNATFRAYGGDEAVAAEAAGVTQKSRILEQLELRLTQELSGQPAVSISQAVVFGPDAVTPVGGDAETTGEATNGGAGGLGRDNSGS